MKLEVEITEDEIRSAIERKIRVAVAEHASNYWIEQGIKDAIKKYWEVCVDKIVKEEIENSSKMREKIQAALENKIRGQLNVLFREKKDKEATS